jgi:hypothetical protein
MTQMILNIPIGMVASGSVMLLNHVQNTVVCFYCFQTCFLKLQYYICYKQLNIKQITWKWIT